MRLKFGQLTDKFGGIQSAFIFTLSIHILFSNNDTTIINLLDLVLSSFNIPGYFIYSLVIYPILIILYFFILYIGIIIDSTASNEETGVMIRIRENQYSIKFRHIVLMILGISLFFMGNGVHYVSNYLWFASFVNGSNSYLTDSFLNDIYIFDELLGHWFMITGLLLLAILLGVHNLHFPTTRPLNRVLYGILILLTIPISLVWNFFVLEGIYGWSGLVLSLIFAGYLISSMYIKHKSIQKVDSFPITALVIIFFLLSVSELLLFLLINGEFKEPHTW